MSIGLLIIGGGLAAQRCCETLRALGHDGPVTVAGAEAVAPYDRPPLSKRSLAGDGEPFFRPEGWYADHGVALLRGARAVRLHAGRRMVELADGSRLRYDDLLVATGSEPIRLPALAGFAGVQALRTLEDAARLRPALDAGARVAVVGGGLIGLEVASSARARGAAVTVIEAAPWPLSALLGPEVGAHLAGLHRADGAELRLGVPVAAARGGTGGLRRVEELVLADGARIAVDHVVEAIGVRPAAGWLAGSGLDPRGVRVDAAGRTALPHVFAAGDVTGGGHWEAAARQGAAVARTLLGLPPAPPAPPSFWSDQLGLRLQCVGDPAGAHAELSTDAGGRGFEAVYRRGGRVSAVLLAGRPASALRAARRLLTPYPELERSAA